jgi:hypothetical protein
MTHRILEGQKAAEVARDLLKAVPPKILAAWDLAPYFVNCVRVVSPPRVINPADQEDFDNTLADAGWQRGVKWTYDVGAYLRVIGTPV